MAVLQKALSRVPFSLERTSPLGSDEDTVFENLDILYEGEVKIITLMHYNEESVTKPHLGLFATIALSETEGPNFSKGKLHQGLINFFVLQGFIHERA